MAANRRKSTSVRNPRDARSRSRAARPTPPPDGAIVLSIVDGCATATLDRPARRNRISRRMGAELMALAETAEDDEAIQALVVTGAGAAFCAGFEPDVDPRLVETLALISKPTVALLNGDALNEGLELALALDLRAAVVGARLGLTQMRGGRLPHFGGTQRLPRLIGATQALLMILSSDPVGGERALQLGLVTYLARDRAELGRVARELLATLTSRGTLALRMVKDAVRKGVDMTLEQGIRLEEDLYALLQTSADRAEGVRAFLEKRRPLFKGA